LGYKYGTLELPDEPTGFDDVLHLDLYGRDVHGRTVFHLLGRGLEKAVVSLPATSQLSILKTFCVRDSLLDSLSWEA
jgi:hypothetical protein